jgi:hypothetical protein
LEVPIDFFLNSGVVLPPFEIGGNAIALGKLLSRINYLLYFGVITKCEDGCVKISTTIDLFTRWRL